MNTLTSIKRGNPNKRRCVLRDEDFKISRLIFLRNGKILTLKNHEDSTQEIPGFFIERYTSIFRQTQNYALKTFGFKVDKILNSCGPIFFDPGLIGVDYYEIQISVINSWSSTKTRCFKKLEWVDQDEIFSRVNHLSRLCIDEYWHM